MRRSQTYHVEVFDQIPTLNELSRAIAASDEGATAARGALRNTELLKALLDKMDHVAHRRLHAASASMLEIGDERNKNCSVSRSFHSL